MQQVPPALSAMGGQSSLVRLPPSLLGNPYTLLLPVLAMHGVVAEEGEVFAVPQYQVVR